jgi:outer membrane protein
MRSLVCLFALAISLSAVSAPVLAVPDSDPRKAGKEEKSAFQETPVDLTQPLTLERAIQIGLQNQSTLGIAQSQLEASRARVTQARSAYFPQIAPSYQYSSQLSTFTVNGQKVKGTVEQSVTQIGAQWTLFDTGKREENVLASRYSARASEYNVLDTRQAVIVNVSTTYYDLLRAKDLVRVAQASVDRARTTLEATRAFAEAGTSPKKDILQAEADYDNAQVQLIQAQNDVRLAMTSLKNAMGILTPLPIITPDTPLPTPSSTPDTRTVADYLKLAFDNRPDVKRETASIDASRHDVKIAQINSGLTVEAGLNEGYRLDPDPGENRTFTTTFSYPLFDAGLTRAQVRQAKANLEQSRRQLQLTKQNIQQAVEQSYLLREEARLRLGATQSALRAAQENYNAARESQKEGAGTIIDVITAQTALVTAEINAVQAIYDFYTADANLQRAIGENDPYLTGGKKP